VLLLPVLGLLAVQDTVELLAPGVLDRRRATWQHASVARRGVLLVAIVLSPVVYHLLVN